MSIGRFIAVVGPSGVGKDSVITGLCAAEPRLIRARRVITRAPDAGGEDYEPATVADFDRLRQAGAFLLSWGAHGLLYGIPRQYEDDLSAGRDVIANLSRAVIPLAAERVAPLLVLTLTAAPETLAARLGARGREDADDITARMSRAVAPLHAGIDAVTISNDGTLEDSVMAARAALYPVNA